jgi:hypothetical protein
VAVTVAFLSPRFAACIYTDACPVALVGWGVAVRCSCPAVKKLLRVDRRYGLSIFFEKKSVTLMAVAIFFVILHAIKVLFTHKR